MMLMRLANVSYKVSMIIGIIVLIAGLSSLLVRWEYHSIPLSSGWALAILHGGNLIVLYAPGQFIQLTDAPPGFSYLWRPLGFLRWLPDWGRGFFQLPLWLPAAFFGVLTVACAVVARKARFPSGQCRQCGYDIRASPVRCPECGAQRSLAVTPTGRM